MLLNKQIPATYMLQNVIWDLFYVLLLSLLVHLITNQYNEQLPEMPLTIPAFMGTAISILLSFKLSQSYDRWWEARKIWGAIVNDSRSLIIQLLSFTPKGNETTVRKIAFRQIAWCYCLGQSLRGLNAMEHLEKFVSTEDLEEMKQHNNKPLACIYLQGRDIKKLRDTQQIEIYTQLQLDNTLVRLCESQGKSERIKATVFPVTYRMFLHAIIYLFVATLSISLKGVGIFFEIPLLLLISSAFFLLEKSATHMQDPFENRPTDTPVTAIAKTIEINIMQLLKESEIPTVHPAENFYLS